jgi:GWxTD domain-containing protein
MKQIQILLICLLGFSPWARAIDASVSYATFKAPQQNYIEIYLHVVGSTIMYEAVDSTTMQAKVEVIILFKQGEEIIQFDKFQLNSPLATYAMDFMDLKRYGLDDGTYILEVSVKDLQKEANAKTYRTEIQVNYEEDQLQQSDIQLLSDFRPAEEGEKSVFVKNGYHLEGLPFNFYNRNAERLIFYNEIYGSDKTIGEDFLVSYSIEQQVGNGETETAVIGHKRKKPAPINVLLQPIDITQLPSGNYELKVDVRNRANELLSSKKVFFQRSNPFLNIAELEVDSSSSLDNEFVADIADEDLEYSLRALIPIASASDGEVLNLLVRNKDPKAQRLYLFNYWARQNPNRPDQAYEEYMNVARAVDTKFKSGFGYGFETDRGYVFLKYGRPSDLVTEWNDPAAPPYEIWSYNHFPATNQNNVRFIFYNPSLDGTDFVMLHSTARGELNNPQWEVQLYRNSPNELDGDNFIDGMQMQDNFGRQARRRFRDN